MNMKYMKYNGFNRYYIIGVCALLLLVGVGYANLNTQLFVNGTTSISRNNWNVKFVNAAQYNSGVASNVNKASAGNFSIDSGTTLVNFSPSFTEPKQIYSFKVQVKNEGTIPAVLDNFTVTYPTDWDAKFKKFIMFDVTLGTQKLVTNGVSQTKPSATNTKITSNNSQDLIIRLEFRNDDTAIANATDIASFNSVFSASNTLNFKIELKYVQA